jgi:hypothetical protein
MAKGSDIRKRFGRWQRPNGIGTFIDALVEVVP